MKKLYSLLLVVCLLISLAIPTYASYVGWTCSSDVELVGDYVQGYGYTIAEGGTLNYVFISTYLYEDNLIVRTGFNQAFNTTSCYAYFAPALYKEGKTYKVVSSHTINNAGIFGTYSSSSILFVRK